MQIPSLRSNTRNHTANENIKVLNEKLYNYLHCPAVKENVKLIPLHEIPTTLPEYNFLLYDDVHFRNHCCLSSMLSKLQCFLFYSKALTALLSIHQNTMEMGSIRTKTGNKATFKCVVVLMIRITMDKCRFSSVFVLYYFVLRIRHPELFER